VNSIATIAIKWGQPLDYVLNLPFSAYMMVLNSMREREKPQQEEQDYA